MLTYQDRLDALRRRKIEHTLAKREQNGYTDLDDFGTVPLPEGYLDSILAKEYTADDFS